MVGCESFAKDFLRSGMSVSLRRRREKRGTNGGIVWTTSERFSRHIILSSNFWRIERSLQTRRQHEHHHTKA